MDKRADRGEFYPGGERSGGAPAPQQSDKVDRVNLGEIGDEYTLELVKQKVNRIVRVIAPAAVCLALCARAATAPLEDIHNNAQVVTNEEDAVAMAAVGALGAAVSNRVEELEAATARNLGSATNELSSVLGDRIAEVTNRVEETYAKKSEIPATPDLEPYALKSELPADYLREGDITNFATRAWINSQGYATEGTVYARIDAQNLALGAATNEMWQAMKSGTNRLWAAHAAASNRVNAATNAIWIAHKADANALRAADTALSNRLEQATRASETAWRAGTNALWYAMKEGTNRLWAAHTAASNRVNAATNAIWIAHKADANALRATDTAASNRVNAATNAIWIAMRAESNRLETAKATMDAAWRAGTNTTMRALRAASNELARADARLDAKIDALELTGGMTRLYTSDAMKWQDATGVVWRVEDGLGPWQATTSSVQFVSWEDLSTEEYDLWKINFSVDGTNAEGYAASPAGLTSYTLSVGEWGYESGDPGEFDVSFVRPTIPGGATNTVNRVAYTNDLERAAEVVMEWVTETLNTWREMGTVYAAKRLVDDGGMYGEVTPSNVWETAAAVARKQDELPYPTNAIPYAAISGAPSGGGQEWRVDNQQSYGIHYVTNGMANVEMGAELSCNTNGWCDGAAMFVRFTIASGVSYEVMDDRVRLVGYGTWPTNNFQSVWWRSGATIYVNILLEE